MGIAPSSPIDHPGGCAEPRRALVIYRSTNHINFAQGDGGVFSTYGLG
jgi:hypothetical protein